MGLSKKRKQHLTQITARAAENNKHRKIDQENQRRRGFLRKQREEEDFWDEDEDFRSESSSDDSNIDESSFDERSSDEENSGVDNGRGDGTQERLGDNNGGVQLELEDHSFKPVWKDDAGHNLRGVRGCGSSATEKLESRRKREMEKSASTTRSIVEMFSTQSNKNQSQDKLAISTPSSTMVSPKKSGEKVGETPLESQTRAVHDLSELLRLKTIQTY